MNFKVLYDCKSVDQLYLMKMNVCKHTGRKLHLPNVYIDSHYGSSGALVYMLIFKNMCAHAHLIT